MTGIGGIDSFNSSALVQFISGATAAPGVRQALNDLSYGFGDILRGAASDGSIFDIRVIDASRFEFSGNLSIPSAELAGVQLGGSEVSIDVARFSANSEQLDVARRAYGLLLAANGLISETELNESPVYAGRSALKLKDSIERLNIDADKSFRINGVRFRLEGERILIVTRNANRDDSEISARRADIDRRLEGLGDSEERIDASGMSVRKIAAIRDDLQEKFLFTFYDFGSDEMVGTDHFAEFALGSASIPDAYFFGQSLGYQLAYATDMPLNARHDVIQQAGAFFTAIVVQTVTNVPMITQAQLFDGLARTFADYGFSTAEATSMLDSLELAVESALDEVFDAMDEVPDGADLESLREGLGIRFKGGIYTLGRYV